jgi:hypothetical protein
MLSLLLILYGAEEQYENDLYGAGVGYGQSVNEYADAFYGIIQDRYRSEPSYQAEEAYDFFGWDDDPYDSSYAMSMFSF